MLTALPWTVSVIIGCLEVTVFRDHNELEGSCGVSQILSRKTMMLYSIINICICFLMILLYSFILRKISLQVRHSFCQFMKNRSIIWHSYRKKLFATNQIVCKEIKKFLNHSWQSPSAWLLELTLCAGYHWSPFFSSFVWLKILCFSLEVTWGTQFDYLQHFQSTSTQRLIHSFTLTESELSVTLWNNVCGLKSPKKQWLKWGHSNKNDSNSAHQNLICRFVSVRHCSVTISELFC